ncbi:MAG: hypothetical protein HY721_11525 [Planctomycetes bacterium]|nr:hypothetical protein [Planctomycetota bacterium]
MVRYYLHDLRGRPDRLRTMAVSPEGSAEKRAVYAYLREPEGAKALLLALLADMDLEGDHWLHNWTSSGPAPAASWDRLRNADLGFIGHAQMPSISGGRRMDVYAYVYTSRGGEVCGVGTSIKPVDSALLDLLGTIAGREIVLPQFSSSRFRILPLEKAINLFKEACPEARGGAHFPHMFVDQFAGPHACIIHGPRLR